MRVELTDTQRELRDTVRAFASERIAPAAADIDRTARIPQALVAELGRLGVLGCLVPERWGGAGLDVVAWALAVEELSAASGATGAVVAAHAGLATRPLVTFGTDPQRDHWLPRLASGEWLGCSTPPEAGIRARRDGDRWRLTGTGRFVMNAPDARVAIVYASVDGARSTAFVVETAARGWTIGDIDDRVGLRGARSAPISLADVEVTADSVLDADAVTARDLARIATAAQAVGIARAAFEAALAYAQERRAFGQPIAEFQGAQWRLADMATAVEAARLLTLRAAFLADRGLSYTREAATAKLFAADTAMTVATQAVQMHGGYGYTREFPVERHFRDARTMAVAGGTPDDERRAVAGALLREAAP